MSNLAALHLEHGEARIGGCTARRPRRRIARLVHAELRLDDERTRVGADGKGVVVAIDEPCKPPAMVELGLRVAGVASGVLEQIAALGGADGDVPARGRDE